MEASTQALRALEAAVATRDVNAMWAAVAAAKDCRDAVPILAELLLADWHECHEDIVFSLGLIGDPRAIPAISKAVLIPFENLVKWNNLHEFQRKCAYALARIATPESRAALETLSNNPDPYIREYGDEGLQKWPLPYRTR
jgi:HEAT repeat protein